MQIDWKLPIQIEHDVARIIAQQEINGFYFDTEKAQRHIKYLSEEREKIYEHIRPMLKNELVHNWAEVRKPYTLQGNLIARCRNHLGDDGTSMLSNPLHRLDRQAFR